MRFRFAAAIKTVRGTYAEMTVATGSTGFTPKNNRQFRFTTGRGEGYKFWGNFGKRVYWSNLLNLYNNYGNKFFRILNGFARKCKQVEINI